MKKLGDFTIEEFEKYREISERKDVKTHELFSLFGIDIDDLSIIEMRQKEIEINSQTLVSNGVKRKYVVNGKRLKPILDITKIKAAQFIDLQTYLVDFKLEEVLTIFLIPQKPIYLPFTKIVMYWKDGKYGEDYNVYELKEFLYSNFKIQDANELSSFFFQSSNDLLTVIQGYLEKKLMKKRLKTLKKQAEVRLG